MQEIIEKLLVLQDRDRTIHHVQEELAHIVPERDGLRANAVATQTQLDTAKNRVKQVEAERKRLELEIESKKAQIEKYANHQLETRKNEEYRALAHEIELAKEVIFKIEDQEINLMEQAEAAQKGVAKATVDAAAAKKLVDEKIVHLDQREANLRKELAELQAGREQMAAGIDEPTRYKYERLSKHKGDNVIVGVEHSVCGGCHMKLPPQTMATCRGQSELTMCNNCGRILYFTLDMSLTAAE
jgi:predicted  nucleic acid-binding Zn-ribbon protein